MTWVAPMVDRQQPPNVSDERSALEGWLDFHRQTLLMKCSGLSVEQLRQRSVAPSTLSLLGLVRHMALVERAWFRERIGGEVLVPMFTDPNPDDPNPDFEFDGVDDSDGVTDFDLFIAEVAAVKAMVDSHDLNETFTFVAWDGNSRTRDVRWAYLHMIEEYARHNGHADLLRERIDGTVGD